jgi:hypothetical protein
MKTMLGIGAVTGGLIGMGIGLVNQYTAAQTVGSACIGLAIGVLVLGFVLVLPLYLDGE